MDVNDTASSPSEAHFIPQLLLKGYAEAGALDGEHESFYRRCCQLIEVKKEEDSNPVG